MNTQHKINIPELMSENNTMALSQSRQKRLSTSRVLSLIMMMMLWMWGNSAWAFTDFEIDLTKNPVGDLPAGVTQISYPQNGASYNDAQHGWRYYAIEFAVDGPVRVTLGGCSSASENSAKVICGTTEQELNTRAVGCYHQGGVVVYDYTGGAGTMQVFCGQYCPYVKVEKMPKEQFVATWDWSTNSQASVEGINLNNNAQQVKSTISSVSLFAISNGNNVKDNGDNLYMNNGGVLKIPAYSAGDNVHFYFHPSGNTWAAAHINGTAEGLDGQNVDYEITKEDVSRGYISFSATATVYLYSITYTHRVFKDFALKLTGDDSFFEKKTGTQYVLVNSSGVATYTSEAPSMFNGKFTLPSYHDNNYGYNNLIAEIPVTPGVYTIGIGNANQSHYVINSADGTINTEVTVGTGFYSAPSTNITSSDAITVQKSTVLTIKNDGSHGTYTPYFSISRQDLPDVVPTYTVTFYDADGETELGTKQVTQGAKIGEITYNATVASGSHFRRWKDSKGMEVNENTVVNKDLAVYACVTAEETVTTEMSYEYDLTKESFYIDEHEVISITGGAYHNNHGWLLGENGIVSIKVAGETKVKFTLCQWSGSGMITGYKPDGTKFDETLADVAACGDTYEFHYTGKAGTITFKTDATNNYIHGISVLGIAPKPTSFKEFDVVMALGKPGNIITEAAETDVEFGIAVDAEGNVTRVAAGASNSLATISGNVNNGHGLTGFTCVTTVPGAVKITVGTCSYDNNADLKVNGTSIIDTPFTGDKTSNCWKNNPSNVMYGIYRGDAGEITITKGGYTPYIKVELFDVEAEPEEDPAGVYDAIVSNVKQLKSALAHSGTASKQYKIFVKNGTYDLETAYNTAVSNYVTIIGESRDGVLIKNHPEVEGLNTSATFQVASNVVLQNITLQCTVDYNTTTQAERGTALYDNGTNNTYRNITLLGRQDTYYSNDNANSYFENCEIHGTVDFICGGGNVWFEKCQILLENRTSGEDVIAAPSTAAGKDGYTFNNCTIDNAPGADMAGKYYLARGWQQEPKCTFNKTEKKIAYAGQWAGAMNGLTEDKIHFTEDADNEATGSKPVTVTVPAAPTNVALNGTTLSWNAVAGAVAYIVYDNGAYIATTTETSYTISAPSPAKSAARQTPATPGYSVAAMSDDGVVGDAGEAGGNTPTSYTFGIGRDIATVATADTPNILESGQEKIKGTAPTGVTVTQTTTCDYANSNATMYHGATDNANKYTAANAWRNMLSKVAVNGNFNEGFYGGFKIDIPDGKMLNVSQIFGDFIAEKNNYSYKFEVVKNGAVIYQSAAKTTSNIQSCGTNNVATTLNTTEIAVLQGLTGTVEFRMPWWIASSAASGAILDFNITATLEDAPGRSFTDFKIDFRTDPYTVIEPAEGLPSGVVVDVKAYHDAQHGVKNKSTITVSVDGPVKFTIGGCGFSNGATVTVDDGTPVAIDTKTPGCDGGVGSYNKFATYTYNVEAPATLVFDLGDYCPYFFAEACDYIPMVDVTYYDTDGTTIIGKESVTGSSALAYKYDENNVTVPAGSKFRGWFNSKCTDVATYKGKKVEEGTALNENLNIYAVATPIETSAKGSTYTYDLTKDYFYQEDHEGITITGGKYYNNHGWSFNSNGTVSIPVPGDSKITFTLCEYGNGGTTSVSSSNRGTLTPNSFDTKVASDGTIQTVEYTGPATTLTFTLGNGGYVHSLKVENAPLAPSDLAIKSGKENINLTVNETYTLQKGTDFTGSVSSLTFTSSKPEIATVSAEGKITAGANYGQTTITVHHDATNEMAEGEIQFTIRVVSAAGQTHKPSVNISADGAVTITKGDEDETPTFYYTLDGTEPTESSATTTGAIPASDANGKVLKVIAATDDKSPSDVVTAYVNVTGDIVWNWNEGGGNVNLVPTISPSIKDALNSNTQAVIGNMLTPGWADVTGNGKFAAFQPKDKTVTLNEQHTVQFNIIPVVGIQFKPTAITFDASRVGTDGGSMDTKLMCGTTVYNLLENQKPDRSNASTGPTYTSFTPDVSAIPASDNEWALQMYIYNLNNTAKYALSNIVVSGTFTGVEYDGVFYSITASTNPAEGGAVRHVPSASKIAAGKDATFIATPSIGYRFSHWTYLDQTESIGTEKTLVVSSIDKDVDVEAHFEMLPRITFECKNSSVEGSVPEAQYTDEDGTFFIPYNYTLYRPKTVDTKQRWSITAWTDGETEYELGTVYTFTKDTKLTPILTSTEKDITDVSSPTAVRWNFDNKEDVHAAPTVEISNDHTDPPFSYTKQAVVDGEKLDMKMIIDVTSGKFTNADARVIGMDGLGAQINNGTKFIVPAVDGMKVRVKASGKKDTLQDYNSQGDFSDGSTVNITFGGETGIVTDNKTLEYTYTGDAATLDIVFVEAGTKANSSKDRTGSWGFYEYIEVVYPVLPDVVLENRIVTTPLLSDKELAENAGTVKKSDNTHPNTGSRYKQGDNVTITAEAKYGYYISAIKSGDQPLAMTKVEPIADAEQPTKATATYIVGAETGTITVEYERLAMSKVRLETTDIKLGDVDFASGSIHENFYTKGEGWVESWFVVGNTETAVSIAADDYIIKEWTDESGNRVETTNACNITVTAEPKTFFASFMHGQKGNVIFDIENPVIVEGTTIKALPAGFGAMHDANSLAPSAVTNSYSFTIPKYHTVFKTGYTLKFWKNKENDNTYMLGSNNSFQTDGENITLVPVYEKNPSDQMNRVNDPIMLYEFGTGAGIRAQQVKLEKNTNTYWTTQVHVVTITDGKEHPHDRDVAMWVYTGDKGFVRNGDLPEWAAFGPGTTFTIASCAGTKVEILSYSPMSTTTFGGEPFTLVSANKEKHEYIYECTTQSTDDRVDIVIGDDYSYYKYIKVYSLKANRVNLHIDVDDKTRGRIDAIQAINTTVEAPIIDLEDGGKSFHQGNNVKITFKRRFGFEFDKIIDVERVDAEGNPLAVVEVLDNGKVKMVKTKDTFEFEELTPTSDGKGGWSTELDLTKHIFYVKKTEPAVDKDDEDMVDSLRTEYEVQFNITTHRNLQVCFKEKPTYYVTYNAGKQATGTAPAAAWIEAGDKFLIPENRTLYYEGYTLKYWKDADYNEDATYEYNKTEGHAYEIGHEYTNPGKDILLYPVFEKNTFGLLDIPAGDGIKVTWPFAKKLGAPTINYEHSAGILVSQLKKSETEWIDLKVDLDGMNGKFNNTAYTDRCQINNNSVLTFPSTNGCEISLHALKEISATTIAGSTNYTKGTDVTTTYNGTEAEQQVLFENGTYPTHFEVTYKPQNITQPTLASVQYGDVTLTPEQLTTLTTSKAISVTVDPDVVNDAVPTVSATANNGVVTVTQADIDNRSAIITLKTTGGVLVETYSVDFSFNVPKTAPKFIKYVIAGVEYPEGQTEIHIDNLPVSGTVRAIFDRTMAEKSIPSLLNDGTYYTAPEGKELAFNYWNLPVDTKSSLTVPANVLEDVYGKKFDQELIITFKTASTTMTPVHRTFNYIVGKDGDINSAITAANAATGTDRYYVFIPDGDYELTGNETIISRITSDGVAPADSTGVNRTDLLNTSVDNHMTQISRANVSLIGQSTQGVTLFNRPLLEGIGYTATIHVGKNALDFYAEDLQLVNRFPYWKSLNAQGSSGAGRAVVFWDQGNRSIMKNVEMWSYQDTYYSSNATPEYRGYFENCTLAGVVDWLCGDGNIWLEKCDIVIRDRAGNNLAAPSQEKNQLWGYVFNECNIKPEVDNPKELKDKNWSLARPWANSPTKSPAATFLKTKMWILPRDAGWEKMGTGAVLRFHEYHSMDKGGNVISLGSRSLAACAPGAGSDDCILSPTDAAKYTLENVMGGSDLFTPKAFTQQIDAMSNNGHKDWDANNSLTWNDDIETDDDRLQWHTEPMALCYFVFKKDEETGKWKYITNVAQSSDDETITGLSIEQYGSGIYMVRAANQRGGLGAPTKEVEFTVSTKYVLSIKQLGDLNVGGVPYGWSTICLPYNSKVPTTDIDGIAKDIKVYAANGNNVDKYDVDKEHEVSNYNIYLKQVDKMNKNLGYVVYGPVGDYQFASSSHTSDVVTILSGNPTDETIPTGNNNCYVLSNKSTWGLGFYKYTGATLAAHRAWLPITAVNNTVQQGVSNNAKCISLVILLEGDDIVTKVEVPYAVDPDVDVIYNLNGIRVMSPTPGHLYIINGKKMIWK